MLIKWTDYTYLQHGTARQISAYYALKHLGIFDALADFSPVLAGTIPLDIDIPGSDLDIICEATDLDNFKQAIINTYSHHQDFTIARNIIDGTESVVASFIYDGFPVEIFGQNRTVEEQNAYRHMVIESRLLVLGGTIAKDTIRSLKASGLKTEPAFASFFHLEDDPYQVLLMLYSMDDDDIKHYLNHR